MKTQDAFLTMLGQLDAPAPKPVVPQHVERARSDPGFSGAIMREHLDARSRPDFADDIDAMVSAMVRAGDVVLDPRLDAYRRPHCRRFRFGE